MKKLRLLSFLLVSMIFSGCSYHEYFILSNATSETISVKYSIDTPDGTLTIFNLPSDIYRATKDMGPNWEHKIPYKDLDISDNSVYIKLPPKAVLLFGIVANDKYHPQTMRTDGGSTFNLKEMIITENGTDILIDKDNFHNYFLKDGGLYKYVIQ